LEETAALAVEVPASDLVAALELAVITP